MKEYHGSHRTLDSWIKIFAIESYFRSPVACDVFAFLLHSFVDIMRARGVSLKTERTVFSVIKSYWSLQ